jgi:hypothetical protein
VSFKSIDPVEQIDLRMERRTIGDVPGFGHCQTDRVVTQPLAEMERRFILERQRAGIEAAKKKGVYKGRKPSEPIETVRRMHGEGKGPAEIAAALGVSRMSVWRALNGDHSEANGR